MISSCQKMAIKHQRQITNYVLELFRAAERPSPDALSQQLLILVEGAIVVAMMQGSADAALHAKKVAAALLYTP